MCFGALGVPALLPARRDWRGKLEQLRTEVCKLISDSEQGDTSWASPPRALSWEGKVSHFSLPPKGTGMLRTPLSSPQAPLSSGVAMGRWDSHLGQNFHGFGTTPTPQTSLNTLSWMAPTMIESNSSMNGPSGINLSSWCSWHLALTN